MKLRMNVIGFLLLFALLVPVVAFAGVSGPSPIPPPPTFQISTTTLNLCKGMINVVPIKIATPAGAQLMQQVQLGLTSSRYAYTVGNGTVSAVNVSANNPVIIRLPIFVNLNTTSIITTGISVNYQYDTLYLDSEIRNISFGIETCAAPLSVKISPYVLTSGKIENVTFNLTDTGTVPLNEISMHASLPSIDGTFLASQPIQIPTIAPKGSVYLNESVFVYRNATQSFPVNLSISLYNGTSLEQLSVNPIVLSSGIINITPSSITLSPQTPTAGGIFSISFVLTDVGTATAAAVTATAVNTKGFSAYGSNSVFVGDMAVDSQTPVTLTLQTANSLKAGSYTIPVRINYLNNLRQNLSTTIDVPVTIGASALTFNAIASGFRTRTSSSSAGLLVTAVLFILVIVLLYLFLKERKKHSK